MKGRKPQVLDCTIRDGGLINKHRFDHRLVAAVYRAVSESGVDYMEMGYRNSRKLFSSDDYGPWMFSSDEEIRRVSEGMKGGAKISIMVDVGRVDVKDVLPSNQSPVDMIRVATYVKDMAGAVALTREFEGKGYETTINVMAISRDRGVELDEALHMIREESPARTVYIVDSFGALYPRDMAELVNRFRAILDTRRIGFHGHNNQQTAFANTMEAIHCGAEFADGTVYGIGRAAGNCPLELLLGFLRSPRLDLNPLLELIAKEFVPLREKLEWGYLIPYALTGILNRHPRSAVELRSSDQRETYRAFYQTLLESEMEPGR